MKIVTLNAPHTKTDKKIFLKKWSLSQGPGKSTKPGWPNKSLKHVNAIEDYQGKRSALNYLRTKEKKEVDFALNIDGEPVQLFEVKLSEPNISPALRYFHKK